MPVNRIVTGRALQSLLRSQGQTGFYYAKGTAANSFHYMSRQAFTITGS